MPCDAQTNRGRTESKAIIRVGGVAAYIQSKHQQHLGGIKFHRRRQLAIRAANLLRLGVGLLIRIQSVNALQRDLILTTEIVRGSLCANLNAQALREKLIE